VEEDIVVQKTSPRLIPTPVATDAPAPARNTLPKKHVLSKSEGMKNMSMVEKPAQSSTPPASGATTPALGSRSNTLSGAAPGLDSAKTGVFASFNRTPTKELQPSILGRILGEKKGGPYPKEQMKKKQALLRTSVHPHMICVPSSAAVGEIGKRDLMEDTHVLLDKIPGVPETIPSGFWAVYDGHGGFEVSRMCEQMLHVRFQKMLINALIIEGKSVADVNVERLLRRCFKETDRQINQKLAEMGNENVGSTAAVCVLLGRRLFCANTGDSEVVVSVNHIGSDETSAVEMSHKHKPRDEREKTRIETLGGMVFGGRVYGTLSVARGFGDTQFKPPVNPQYIICPDPDVKVIEMAPQHRYVILACDGLWDKVTHEEAAIFVHELRQNGYSVEECAAWLVKEADDRISRDNISVIVVDLQWSIDAKLENPNTCAECNAVSFGVKYCTKCGLPWPGATLDNSMRQAPSVKGKREKSFKIKRVKPTIEESEEEEFVIGTPTDVAHKAHAQSVEEAKKLLGK
jgi:serine/threonine protein phosphatase PrpC